MNSVLIIAPAKLDPIPEIISDVSELCPASSPNSFFILSISGEVCITYALKPPSSPCNSATKKNTPQTFLLVFILSNCNPGDVIIPNNDGFFTPTSCIFIFASIIVPPFIYIPLLKDDSNNSIEQCV